MDPQHRLLLETAWQALEDAGYSDRQLMGSPCGVYLGLCNRDYEGLVDPASAWSGTGNAFSLAAGRISYHLGLKGPSLTLDTASSSSLVAIHQACQSLRAGECRMALAGGANLMLTPEVSLYMANLGALSPEGRSKVFDAAADGYVRSEGCGLVVLKLLSQARLDNDQILALVQGGCLNQDGRSQTLTSPDGDSQEALLLEAWRQAGIRPEQLGYLEAHGTGTRLGDQTEVAALGRALGNISEPVLIGSVKTNIGHCEAAAGVAGFIKVVLALRHREIPAHLHWRTPNPLIPWEQIAVRVVTRNTHWPAGKLAGVSSFGLSGTNAHLVLEQAPARPSSADPEGPYVLPLSARHPGALRQMIRDWAEQLRERPQELGDFLYTAAQRRSHHPFRLAVVGESAEQLARALLNSPPGGALAQAPRLVFVFSGQGSQWAGMGLGLLSLPAFRRALEACDQAIASEVGWSLLEVLESRQPLDQGHLVQPLIFAVQVALAALWRSWGLEPEAVVGHSVGEIAAAHVAGALSLKEASRIVCRRSQLMARVAGRGGMISVELSRSEAEEAFPGLEVAAVNGPRSTVLSGPLDALQQVQAADVKSRLVRSDVACHSSQLDPLKAELFQELQSLQPAPPGCRFYSTVSGGLCTGQLDAAYWVDNLRQPVQFAAATQSLLQDGFNLFLEISPHPILVASMESLECRAFPSFLREQPEQAALLASLASLYQAGCEPDWTALTPQGHPLSLPPYPFQRRRYWANEQPVEARPQASHPWQERLNQLSIDQRPGYIREFLLQQLSQVLDTGGLTEHRAFRELGLDSLGAVQLRGALAAHTGLALPASLIFDYPNLAALSSFLLDSAPAAPDTLPEPGAEAIAIIGLGCRLPGAPNPEQFWRLLEQGQDAIQEVPSERWPVDEFYDPNPEAEGKMVTRWGGFLAGIDGFDADFFGISPREAQSMDPQQRLLLEVCWEALEDAGQAPDRLMGRPVGVFMGLFGNDYAELMQQRQTPLNAYTGTGTAHSVAAGRIAYLLGTQGPCLTVDTACSASLAAVHLASQSLRAGECEMALAGGVNLLLSPQGTVYFSRLRAMSADGRCKAFDESADGYVRSEGCGVVVLKSLRRARQDGDRVLAVLRGSAMNQDGRSNGLTAPNGPAQERVIAQALAQAGMKPDQIGYVEAHGTGTPLGDPIELRALGRALARSADRPLLVGSVKTNIGHTEAAAGVAGLIKTVLMLRHGRIPPHLHLRKPSSKIPWGDLALRVPTQLSDWPADSPRVAGVSSYGFSGTNVHVIVSDDPVVQQDSQPAEGPWLLPLSARSRPALQELAGVWQSSLDLPLANLTRTAMVGRSHHAERLAVVAPDRQELARRLSAFSQGQPCPGVSQGRAESLQAPKLVFVFPGQGGQWPGMGCSLYASEPVFRAALDRCQQVAMEEAGLPLVELLHGQDHSIEVIQPCLFAIQVALVELWASWGIRPQAVIGHSMGEIAAAYCAGSLSLEEATRIICRRSRLLKKISGQGAMAVVELTQQQARQRLQGRQDRLSVAVCNSPRSTVIAGEPGALQEVLNELQAEEIFCRPVQVEVASHSPQVDPLLDELRQSLQGLCPSRARWPIYSTVTGRAGDGLDMGPEYWADNLRQPVQFAHSVEQLDGDGFQLFLEISPHPVLVPVLEPRRALPSLRRDRPEKESLYETLGQLYCAGMQPDWLSLAPPGSPVSLPTYPWQRQSYWLDPVTRTAPASYRQVAGRRPLRVWERSLEQPWLADHRVEDTAVYPAAGFVDMMLEALPGPVTLSEVSWSQACLLANTQRLQLVLEDSGQAGIYSQEQAGGWTLHSSARLSPGPVQLPQPSEPVGLSSRAVAEHFRQMSEMGLHYGPAFQDLEEIWTGEDECFGRLRAGVSPITALDACFQLLLGLMHDRGPTVPVALSRLTSLGPLRGQLFCQVRRHDASILIWDHQKQPLLHLSGMRFQRLRDEKPGLPTQMLWHLQWRRQDLVLGQARRGSWLLIGQYPELVHRLEAAGQQVVMHNPGRSFAESLAQLTSPCLGLICAHGLTSRLPDGQRQAEDCALVVELLQALNDWRQRDQPRLWLLTRGAQSLGVDAAGLSQSPLLGLARTVRMEQSQWRTTSLDLDPQPAREESEQLWAELINGEEEEVAFRSGLRYVGRLQRGPAEVAPERVRGLESGPWRVETDRPGTLERVCARPLGAKLEPTAGQVCIEVEVTGLNFKDVLLALGFVPGEVDGPTPLGLECVGRVASLGAGVTDLAVGQSVIAMGSGCLASHLLTSAELVIPLPEELTPEQAAGMPIAHLTAYYALAHLGRLRRGEKVLIHAATGGVGQAAIQWARHVGAEIYATTSNADKRAWLHGQGIDRVYDSRSLAFVDEILAATDGKGVDVVLNSLAGPMLTRSLGLLAPYGRFLELGLRDVLDNAPLDLGPFARNLSFSVVDLGSMLRDRPDQAGEILREVFDWVKKGVLKPLTSSCHPLSELPQVLHTMAQGRHLGKLLIDGRDPQARVRLSHAIRVRAEASYVISGGLGGLGLGVAGWLADQGARHLLLLGRRPASEEANQILDCLRQRGVKVEVAQLDVSSSEALAACLKQPRPPIAGVIHAAGVLDDAMLLDQTREKFERVFQTKVLGAYHLHQHTLGCELDFFVLYSSVASLLGLSGQANYAAGNAFLDALAHFRQGLGLPALCLNWGPFREVGMATDSRRGQRLEQRGLGSLSPQQGVELLGQLLSAGQVQVAVAPFDLRQWLEFHPQAAASTLLAELGEPQQGRRQPTMTAQILASPELLEDFVRTQLAQVLRLEPDSIDPQRPFQSLGVDSLMSLELRNRLEIGLGLTLRATLLWTYPNLAALLQFLQSAMQPEKPAPPSSAPVVADLSEAELIQQVQAELAASRKRRR